MPGLFRKVLIANRGEIAVRIMQTCAELGIPTVAVYSAADAHALHVSRSDEAIHIGPAPAAQSYLAVDRIVGAARECGADAIHPGYGFLSESARFAQACRDAGITFIGPTPEAMGLLGSKRAAKRLAREAGVPIVPGYEPNEGEEPTLEDLRREAERIGFPLLIKASAGGGGKGMRTVSSEAEFPAALESAKREAKAAFGDDTVLLEKLIERLRHVEIQLLADTHGNVVHLGERDCSAQRRHQKVIEESPSPAVTNALRARMGEAAVALARAAGYMNAGTAEFIVTPEGEFYFLEVNTRLQVEHPVTELVTGMDLVREQLRIAAGERLPVRQEEVSLRGHAIECRVYAEDPAKGFLPSTGVLERWEVPLGVGIRVDAGVEVGSEVTPYYDPMLAKVIVWAPERGQAIERARGAMGRMRVGGVVTNVGLLRAVLGSEEFRAGEVTTRFLDERLDDLLGAMPATTEEPTVTPVTDFNPWRGFRGTLRSPGPPSQSPGGLARFARSAPETPRAALGGSVLAPLTGTVVKVGVAVGDGVEAGQVVVVLEAMKMEISVEAPREGTVTRMACAAGDLVQANQVLAEIGD